MGQKKKKKTKASPEVGLKAAKKAARAKTMDKAPKAERIDHPTIHTEKTIMTTQKHDFEKFTNEATAASKESVDALLKTGTALAKGTEDLMKVCLGLAQDNTEKSVEGVKTLMACKTLNELTEVQNKLAQQSFENYIASVTKISELTVKLANTAFEPINTQFGKTMKKATDSVAA